jgi:very-short-patch-repair endonuclease
MKPYKAGDTERSKPHRRIENILDQMGLNYLSEFKFPPYIVDIYLPEWHLAIEVDGPFHSKGKDYVRDRYILEFDGVPILRINATIWNSTTKLKAMILKFIEDNAVEVEERKDKWSTAHSSG